MSMHAFEEVPVSVTDITGNVSNNIKNSVI